MIIQQKKVLKIDKQTIFFYYSYMYPEQLSDTNNLQNSWNGEKPRGYSTQENKAKCKVCILGSWDGYFGSSAFEKC